MKKRIAIVGCGAIAKTHGLAIQDLGYECVAVTDIRPEAAEAFSQKYPELRADWLQSPEDQTLAGRKKLRETFLPPKVYPNLTAMRDAGPLDAVIIATLPSSHCELVCEAAEIGARAVLCEKPMAMSAVECEKMIEICRVRGARLAVYQESMMVLRQFREARRIVSSRQIGKVEFIRANTVSTLMDWSVYLWAGIVHLLPGRQIVEIEATLDCRKKAVSYGHAQEDAAAVHFTMSDGVHGMLFTGRDGFSPHGIRIDGSEGSVEVAYVTAPTLRCWRQGTRNWEVITPARECGYDDRRDFLEGIVSDDPFYLGFDGASGFRSMLPVIAAWQSHLERRPFSLSESINYVIPRNHL